MRMLMAGGRVAPKVETPRRTDSIVVIIKLEGDDARRFESHRGNRCPREVLHTLVRERLTQIEEETYAN